MNENHNQVKDARYNELLHKIVSLKYKLQDGELPDLIVEDKYNDLLLAVLEASVLTEEQRTELSELIKEEQKNMPSIIAMREEKEWEKAKERFDEKGFWGKAKYTIKGLHPRKLEKMGTTKNGAALYR